MWVLAELAACEREAGELGPAIGHSFELAQVSWDIHCRQSAQLVEEVWAAAEHERERRALEAQTAEAYELMTTLRRVATEQERARIARELHDVLTHNVTAMVVQADAGQFLPGDAGHRVAQVFDTISQTGRRALGELRELLGLMSVATEGTAPVPRRVSDLADEARQMGQPVELHESGDKAVVPEAAQLAAYRVVEEALTNALKYAQGRPAVVELRYGHTAVDVSITTDGPAETIDLSPVVPSGGRGLRGLG